MTSDERRQVLVLAASDMAQAAEAARAIQREAEREAADGEPNVNLLRALETAVAVCYWRPFTRSSVGQLDPKEDGPPEDSGFIELHKLLHKMRDQVYAHTDVEGGRTAEVTVLPGVGHYSIEGWKSLPRDLLPDVLRLANLQRERFIYEAGH